MDPDYVSRNIFWDTLSATCVLGTSAIIPAIAGSFVGHTVYQYCDMPILDHPYQMRWMKIALIAGVVLVGVGIFFLSLNVASMFGLNITILDLAGIRILSMALSTVFRTFVTDNERLIYRL